MDVNRRKETHHNINNDNIIYNEIENNIKFGILSYTEIITDIKDLFYFFDQLINVLDEIKILSTETFDLLFINRMLIVVSIVIHLIYII